MTAYYWGATSTSRLLTCHPLLIELWRRVIVRPGLPYDLHVVYGYRSTAEQAALYAQGRTTAGPIRTYAKPGTSKHNRSPSQAIDVIPIVGGRPDPDDWGPIEAIVPHVRAEWSGMEAEGRVPAGVALVWGGDWKMRDGAHWELRGV